jgi:ElaB/YqjD/DUF883 family membrane-anchored ribosome-binding protein|tara:strand:+ start:85 stop:1812 length:1728 start_codon:yes stop_codon:yes gene_type:complete
MALTRDQVIENIQSLGEQGADLDTVSEYIRSEGLDPNEFIEKTEETKEPQDIQVLRKKLDQIKAYDEKLSSIPLLGVVLNTIGKTLDMVSPGEDLTSVESVQKRLDRRLDQEKRGLLKREIVLENLSDDAKKVLVDFAKFAPFMIPAARGTKVLNALQKAHPAFKGTKAGKVASKLIKGAITGATTAPTVSASRFVEELASGENLEKSVDDAKKAGVSAGAVAMALPLIGGGINLMSKIMTPLTKKSAGFISEVLSSVPQESYKRALDKELKGQSIFKGKYDSKVFEGLGKKAQNAINHINKEAGKEVGAQKAALRNANIKISSQRVIKKLDDMVAEKEFGGETSLKASDLKLIRSFREKLLQDKGNLQAAKLNVIKNQINNELPKTAFDPQTVSKISSEGQGILKSLAQEINSDISSAVPSFAKVNQKFSQVRGLRDRLQSKMKDENVGRNLRNLYNKDGTTQQLFEELNDLSPSNLKFIDELKDNVARAPFEEIFPGLGGGSGSGQGAANIGRLFLAGQASTSLSPQAGVGALLLTSPKTQKALLRTGVKATKGLPPLIERGLPIGVSRVGEK